jgi:hypothetical protein
MPVNTALYTSIAIAARDDGVVRAPMVCMFLAHLMLTINPGALSDTSARVV